MKDTGNDHPLMPSRRAILGLAGGTLGWQLLPSPLRAQTSPSITANPKLTDPKQTLPRTVALLEKLQQGKVQIGSQLYLSRHGKPLADFALGLSRADVPMTTDSMMIWFSSTKAITAVAVAQQWERGKFDLDDPVAKYIPEFGNRGKEAITIRHVLTHRGGFRLADGGNQSLARSMADNLKTIYQAELEAGWVPGQKAGYHPTSGWFILGELVQRTSGKKFSAYVRDEIFLPLGMNDCWVGMPVERFRAYGNRIGWMHATPRGVEPRPTPMPNGEAFNTDCSPGAGGRGPMRELARFYEMLLNRGTLNGKRILSPQTVEAITARQRTAMLDQTFNIVIDWGLGFIIDAFLYGNHCSPRAFGHAGAQSSVGFCDPEHGLVAAYVLNGMPGSLPHNQRMLDLANAIYFDLGLAKEGDAGKPRELPKAG
ncbi:MAG: beta-lactamase family protein [Acidobacteria bacterium]|nr:beta-lactamase family protein [Acidobacteriota bacterium]